MAATHCLLKRTEVFQIRTMLAPTLLLLFSYGLVAASPADSTKALQEKYWNYISQHPATHLFLHTDKNIYSPNERIWFKAYTLSGAITDSKVLYVRLLDANKNLMLRAAYPMYDIRAHGDLLLPDTLKDGDYFLYAYADRMINFSPADVFMQSIRIHKNQKRWRAAAYIRDTSKLKRGLPVDIIVELRQNNERVRNVKGHYQLLDGTTVVKQGGLKTNLVGEAFISFTYPQIGDNKTLTAKIFFEDEKDYEEVLLHLGHEGNMLEARVFTEGGGNFIEGATNNMTVAVTDVNENPVAGAAVTITSGNTVVATAVTGPLGTCPVLFKPVAAATYTLEIMYNGKPQSMPLPVTVKGEGYVLTTGLQNGKPSVTIYNRNSAEQVLLAARSFDSVLWSKSITIPANNATTAELPADSFPKEIIALNLLDTSGHAVAERLWMNPRSEACHLTMTCDKAQYGTRKKVVVTLTAKDNNGQPVKINASVAVAEIHTTDTATMPGIAYSYYFKNTGMPAQLLWGKNYSIADINTCLTTKNWAGYDWNSMQRYLPAAGIRIFKNTSGVYGTVTMLNKKKKLDLKDLTMLSKDGLQMIAIDEYGRFDIPSANLLSPRNNQRNLVVGTSFREKYVLEIRHYDDEFDKRVMVYEPLYPLPVFTTYAAYKAEALEKLTSPHQLQAVIVRKTKDIPWNAGEFKSTTCNDWVCMYNILNCRNHPFGTIPVNGEIYTYMGLRVVYRGCGNTDNGSVVPLKIVYTPNTFTITDFEKEQSNEEEMRSTLFWEPNLDTGADGTATFSFFTNDIVSAFTIRLQGVTMDGLRPLEAVQIFMVK